MRKDTVMRKTLSTLLRRVADRLWTVPDTPIPAVEVKPNHWTWTAPGFVLHFDSLGLAEQIKEMSRQEIRQENRRRLYLAE